MRCQTRVPMKNQSIRISLFYCSNSLQEEELFILNSKIKNIKINSISLPCSGKVNIPYLLKAIETGADGVLLVSCKLGNCRYLQGNYRAQKRIEYVDDLLCETGFSRGHAMFISLDKANKIDTILSAIDKMIETFKIELQEA
jgi:coenzyme F420-reducing hydrogenase delta subunit